MGCGGSKAEEDLHAVVPSGVRTPKRSTKPESDREAQIVKLLLLGAGEVPGYGLRRVGLDRARAGRWAWSGLEPVVGLGRGVHLQLPRPQKLCAGPAVPRHPNPTWPGRAALQSGKSTLLKQMKVLHKGGYSRAERVDFVKVVHSNTVLSAKAVYEAFERLGVELPEDLAQDMSRRESRRAAPLQPAPSCCFRSARFPLGGPESRPRALTEHDVPTSSRASRERRPSPFNTQTHCSHAFHIMFTPSLGKRRQSPRNVRDVLELRAWTPSPDERPARHMRAELGARARAREARGRGR